MSGAEAITAIQLISACIDITEAIIDIGHAVHDSQGLPPKLRDLIETLPAIEDILESALEKCKGGEINENTSRAAEPILGQCKEALDELQGIFKKACPRDGENRTKRIWRGTKTVFLGRDSRVRKLLVTIHDNLKILEQKEIYAIGDKLDALQQATEALVDNESSKYTHTGAGSIFTMEGGHQENYVGGGSNNRYINRPGVYHEGPATYSYHTHAPVREWTDASNKRDRAECLYGFMQSLYRNACLYRMTKDRNRQRVPGTCKWFTNHALFKQWASATTDQAQDILLVTADPGCGKSVLSRYLIDEVLPLDGRIVCYFFFKDDFEDQKSCLRAICTVLHQLFDARSDLLTDAILDTFKKQGEKYFESFTDLWTVLVGVAAQQDIICVFDALDECSQGGREQLLNAITSLHATQSSKVGNKNIRCLLTSRPYDHILRQMRLKYNTEMALIHLQGDQGPVAEEIVAEIRLVVDSRIDETAECLKLTLDEHTWLRAKLESIPNRTYLWITLIFDGLINIETGIDKNTVLQMLAAPPSTVDDAYEKILNRTSKENAEDAKKARRVALHAILAAKRPLALRELSVVLGFQAFQNAGRAQDNAFDFVVHKKRFRERLRDLCGLFVVIVDDKVYLLHQTAREFLLSRTNPAPYQDQNNGQLYVWKQSMSLVESNSVLANICARYLLLCFAQGNTCLLEYSAIYWTLHYRQSSAETRAQLVEVARDLCSSFEICEWLNIYQHASKSGLPAATSPLCTAAFFGLDTVVQLLLAKQGYNVLNAKSEITSKHNRSGFSLFSKKISRKPALAIGKNSSSETSLTAYVNATDSSYDRSPLSWAAEQGREAVVKLLLETGKVDVNVKDKFSQTPLLYAADYGHEAVIQLLLETGKADLNVKDRYGMTPLSYAAKCGREAIVKLLLGTSKVDIDVKDKFSQTPLLIAAEYRHEAVAKLLLETGKVDLNATDGDGRTPLLYAAQYGHEAMVKLLLETGKVDLNVKDRYGRTPLLYAVRRRHEAIVKPLLNTGKVDVNATDDNGWTPLMWAMDQGNEAIVKLLQQQLGYGV